MTTFNKTARLSAVALTLALSGCATAAQSQMASFLVRQGEPSVSFDDPASAPKPQTGAKPPAAQLPKPEIVERTSTFPTVEKIDARLGRALEALQRNKSVANHLEVAAQYRRVKILDKSFEHVDDALALDKRSGPAFELRAQLWRDSGFPSFGLADAHRAVFLAPRSASAHNTLGTLLQGLGQYQAARQEYLRVIELDAAAVYAWSNLCYLSLREGDHDRAADECQTAVQMGPVRGAGNAAESAFNLGMLYLAAGEYQRAEETFGLAINLRPRFSAAEVRRKQAARLAATTVNSYDDTDDGNRP